MLVRRIFFGTLLLTGALITACGGGGGGAASSGIVPKTPTQGKSASATVKVLIPNANGAQAHAARKTPQYVSSQTASLVFSITQVDGASPSPTYAPTSVNVNTSSDCSPVTDGKSCVIPVVVPIASSVVLEISAYDANNALLSTGSIGPIDTTLSPIPSPSPVSLGGVPASLVWSQQGLSAPDDGQQHASTISITAKDADGNTILPPGNFPNAIAFSVTGDPNGALSVTPATIASPNASGTMQVTVAYNAAISLTQAEIKATSGTISQQIPFAPIVTSATTLDLDVGGSAQSMTISEAGYSGAFSVTMQSDSGLLTGYTCSPASCTPASAGGAVTFTFAQGSTTGTDIVTLGDTYNGSVQVPITVTSSSGGGSLVGPPYTIDTFPVPLPSAGASTVHMYGITTGPDGQTLWAVDQYSETLDAIAVPGSCSAGAGCTIISQMANVFTDGGSTTYPQSIAAAPDGNLYVTDQGNGGSDLGTVYQLSNCASGTCTPTAQSIGGLSAPAAAPILAGPDGNVYFGSESNLAALYDWGAPVLFSPAIGCCSFSLEDGIFPLWDGTASQISGLAVDASGSTLWFVDTGDGNVGYYGIPCGGQCGAYELPLGTNGADAGDAHVRRNPPAAKRVRHPYAQHHLRKPSARARMRPLAGTTVTPGTAISTQLGGIVSGPDGYLYVADPGNNTIDQIDPNLWDGASSASYPGTPCNITPNGGSAIACTYTAISLPHAGGTPQNLAVGPDGNIWFTDSTGYVGFVSLATCANGNCQAYEYSVGGAPWGITAGPDGDVWFTFSTPPSGAIGIGKVVLQ